MASSPEALVEHTSIFQHPFHALDRRYVIKVLKCWLNVLNCVHSILNHRLNEMLLTLKLSEPRLYQWGGLEGVAFQPYFCAKRGQQAYLACPQPRSKYCEDSQVARSGHSVAPGPPRVAELHRAMRFVSFICKARPWGHVTSDWVADDW